MYDQTTVHNFELTHDPGIYNDVARLEFYTLAIIFILRYALL